MALKYVGNIAPTGGNTLGSTDACQLRVRMPVPSLTWAHILLSHEAQISSLSTVFTPPVRKVMNTKTAFTVPGHYTAILLSSHPARSPTLALPYAFEAYGPEIGGFPHTRHSRKSVRRLHGGLATSPMTQLSYRHSRGVPCQRS